MATLPSTDTPKTDMVSPDDAIKLARKKRNKLFKHGIASCKNYRRKLVRDWSLSVDYRRGKPFASQTDEDRVAVNLDWSFTKMKQASLFSQMPPVRLNHPPQTLNPQMAWVGTLEKIINDTLASSGAETAMFEAIPDCINAAGIGIILVSHEAITEMVEVPAVDFATMPPQLHQQIMSSGMMPDGTPVPMETVPNILDHRYCIRRISPADFLWPINFNGSDFDDAPWIGRSGRVSWYEAKRRWKLDEKLKSKYLGVDRNPMDTISNDTEKEYESGDGDELVGFDEVFFYEKDYSDNPKAFAKIGHLIFVNGQEEPVVDEAWEGQQNDPQSGQIIGALRYPIRVLALSYVTDDAIPPSDSAVARPQVNEINKSRTQMILQREHSLPLRTFDVNRVDPTIQFNLMQGRWQGMIPVQGNGQNIITEVGTAKFPSENITFYRMAMEDLTILWQTGQAESGVGVETKGEANVIQQNTATRLGQERARVGKFYTSIAEVLGGLICIFEDPKMFGQGFTPVFSRTLAYSILADSTVLLSTQQRLKQINEFINLYAKTGWVDMGGLLKEAAMLTGIEPSFIRPPQPKPPAEPNISLRLTGTEDLMNPLALGQLIKSGQAPEIKDIDEAKKRIAHAVMPMPQPVPQLGPDGQVLPQPPDDPSTPSPPPPEGVGDANPEASALPKINQRVLEREGNGKS